MTSGGRGQVDRELEQRREQIVRSLLVGLAVLGILAYVPSVWLSLRLGVYPIAVVDTLAYAALLAILAFGAGRTRLQSAFLVGVCYALGVFLSVVLGPVGAGPIWLTTVPVITAVLFGHRATLASLGLMLVTIVLVALGAQAGLFDWIGAPDDVPLWIVMMANALVVGGGVGLAVGALVAGLRESAARAARVTAELRQAEKLTAIGTLAAGIAHDFNNLLTPVLAAPEILRDETVPREHRDQILDRVEEAANAGRLLVQRILSFSRPTSSGRAPLDAAAAFSDALRLLRASLPGGVIVETDIETTAHVRLTPAEVHQLVLNLGSNAQKAMPEGGRLVVRVDEVAGEDVVGPSDASPPERVVRIQVADTGIGMDADTALQVFDPFFTTDMESGTGMGLATVHGIVTSAGGTVQCSSEIGVGTTFTIHLPVVEPEAVEADQAPAETPLDAGGHLLLVEDEPAVREVTARALRRMGFEVTAAEDGRVALEVLESGVGIRAVITDLNMPGVKGTHLAREIRRRDPSIRIILMTGLIDQDLEEVADQIGIDRLLPKPFRVAELLQVVQAVLADPDP